MGRVEVDLTTGAQTIDRAKRWPWATIANHTADVSIATFERCSAAACADLDDSFMRFNRVTEAARAYGSATPELSRLFADLKTVDQGYPKTTWNEVYTVEQRGGAVSVRLSYKAPGRAIEDL